MSRARLAMILMAGLLCMVGGVLPDVRSTPRPEGTPVPTQATVSIEGDRKEYFLGENVLLHFCIENNGHTPFQINLGGAYRGASRDLRFGVSAFGAAGKLCDDPDPSGFCMGGISYSPSIEPGKRHYESIPLLRYRRIEEPGVYKIRASHSLGWSETPDRMIPVAETTIHFIRPNEDQARKIVDAMSRAPADNGRESGVRCSLSRFFRPARSRLPADSAPTRQGEIGRSPARDREHCYAAGDGSSPSPGRGR